jgi:hypothetical protein
MCLIHEVLRTVRPRNYVQTTSHEPSLPEFPVSHPLSFSCFHCQATPLCSSSLKSQSPLCSFSTFPSRQSETQMRTIQCSICIAFSELAFSKYSRLSVPSRCRSPTYYFTIFLPKHFFGVEMLLILWHVTGKQSTVQMCNLQNLALTTLTATAVWKVAILPSR